MVEASVAVKVKGGDSSSIKDLKKVIFLLKTKRTLDFAYGFMFAFLCFTIFLAFNPNINIITNNNSSHSSHSSSFTNIFTTSSSSLRSHFSSLLNYIFPTNNNTTTTPRSPISLNTTKAPLFTPTKTKHKTEEDGVVIYDEGLVKTLMNCDFFDGNWIRDDSYPLYKPGSCSFTDEQFNCIINGRPDNDYQKFKWKPKGCTLPRIDGEASYSFIFKDYNCTIEFFVSPFLVQEWEMSDKNGTKKETLRLDLVGKSSDLYKTADIIIFNTGHWWTHDKTSKGRDYYQEGSHVYDELDVLEAFRKALTTWARWVDANVKPEKSWVFFRGYSASHFSGGQWNSGGACDHETTPIKNDKYLRPYPSKMLTLERIFRNMKTHISYLNVTRLTDYRKDSHPSIYGKKKLSEQEKKSPALYQDCSHWCLPGVPDTWNEILYAELLIRQYQKEHQSDGGQTKP
ncbi:hypothetical protein ACFE04_000217 [Oxalis oulophora]